ncbi:hypothetical protein [Mesorhizobium sp. M0029]|uniref:hypothetical protein n=1 Tax=Mesorhizobium sp. M0029 TaxID=2956850 RepID=UPI00333D720C
MNRNSDPDIISSEDVIEPGKVEVDPDPELIKVKAAVAIAAAAILIGVGFLIVSICIVDNELKSWATGLISLVVGAAIGFVFSSSSRAS